MKEFRHFSPPPVKLGQRDGAVPRAGPALPPEEAGPARHHQTPRQAHQDVPEAGLEKTRVKKKNQPSGFFWVFWFFFGVF